MIVDTLTIAGFVSAASFLLMPLLMGREFVHVQAPDQSPDQSQSASMGRSAKAVRDSVGLNGPILQEEGHITQLFVR